jgi:hypothetical protein
MPMSLGTMIVIVIVILILLPLTVWVRRLQARGVISDDRPLGRVIRERLTGKPAQLTPPDYRQSRLRYYSLVLLTVPIATAALTAITKPHNALGLVVGPALIAGMLVLGISEDRFTGVSRRQRIACASLSGLGVAMLAFIFIAGLDPHAAFTSSGR